MTEGKTNRAGSYWGLVGFALLLGALVFWLTRAEEPMQRDESDATGAGAEVAGSRLGESTAVPGARAPAQIIADRGRLRVTREELREGDVLAIGLVMPDEERGEGALRVKLADVSGRAMETRGFSIDGAGTGLRIEIDPEWLLPGRYMIQVETAEKRPLGLRRYVLEVVDEDAAE